MAIRRTRVFQSGNSQAVRLPKEFRVTSSELEIFRRGDEIVLREAWKSLEERLSELPPLPGDFVFELPADPPADASDDPFRGVFPEP